MAFAEPTVAPHPGAVPRGPADQALHVPPRHGRRPAPRADYDVDCLFPDRALPMPLGDTGERHAHLQRLHGVGDLPGRRGLTPARRRDAPRHGRGGGRGRQRGGLYAGFCPAVPRGAR